MMCGGVKWKSVMLRGNVVRWVRDERKVRVMEKERFNMANKNYPTYTIQFYSSI